MGVQARHRQVDGHGAVVRRVRRRRHEDDGAALANGNGVASIEALDVAGPRGGAAIAEMLARADSATRARMIVGLQRMKGNAHVQRLLQREDDRTATGEAVRREPAIATDDTPKLNSAMFSNDGVLESVMQKKVVLDVNKNGPSHVNSIRKLQQGLIAQNLEITAGPTGFFGQQTKTAVEKFQVENQLDKDGRVGRNTLGKLDALLPAAGPSPNPNPNPNPQPGPTPGPLVPELSAAVDATLIQYQFMLTRQRDALAAVRRDLGDLDKPAVPFVKALFIQLLKSTYAFVFGATGEGLKIIVEHALEGIPDKDRREIYGEASAEVFKNLGLEEKIVHLIIEDPGDPLATLDAWFDYRLRVLTEAGLKSQLHFVTEVKPDLLRKLSNDPRAIFLRLLEAKTWEIGVGQAAAAAFEMQKGAELNDWAIYQAQAALKKPLTAKKGTDLRGAEKNTAGVLELVLHGQRPEDGFPVKVESARITGFSKRTRQQLQNKPIGQLTGIPIAGRGTVVLPPGAQAHIDIGRNEKDEHFSWNEDKRGERWLKFRSAAAATDKPSLADVKPEDIDKASAEDGARRVFLRDIDDKKPKDLPGGLDKA